MNSWTRGWCPIDPVNVGFVDLWIDRDIEDAGTGGGQRFLHTGAQLAARIDPNPFRSKGAGHRRQIVRADASDRRRIHPPADRAGAGTHLSVVEDSPGHPDPVRNRSGNLRAMHQESPVPGDAYDVFFRSSQGHANGSGDAASMGEKSTVAKNLPGRRTGIPRNVQEMQVPTSAHIVALGASSRSSSCISSSG